VLRARLASGLFAETQVYKMNLVDVRPPAGQAVDSARQNLANTFVNAFVNAGFGQVRGSCVVRAKDKRRVWLVRVVSSYKEDT